MWVLRMAATVLLVSFLSIWTTGYIVTSYVDSMIKELNLPIKTPPFAMSGLWGTLWGADTPSSEQIAQEDEPGADDWPPPAPEPTPEASADVGNPEPTDEAGPSESPPETAPESSPPADPGDASASPDPEAGGEDGSEPVFGNGMGSGLTEQERNDLYASVVSKLNAEQLSRMSAYLNDGLTEQELVEIEDMLRPVLDEEELTQLMLLLDERAEQSPPVVPSSAGELQLQP